MQVAPEDLADGRKSNRHHGERGKGVVRFEWRSFKRILQTEERRQWYPVRATTSEVYERVYREDDRARDDFSTICSRQPPACPIQPEAVSGQEALRNEYLVSVMEEHTVYSVSQPRPAASAAPAGEPAEDVTYFQLLEMSHGSRRPLFDSLRDPGADVALQAGLALLVVVLKPRAPDDIDIDVAGPATHVFTETGPVWMRPGTICPFD